MSLATLDEQSVGNRSQSAHGIKAVDGRELRLQSEPLISLNGDGGGCIVEEENLMQKRATSESGILDTFDSSSPYTHVDTEITTGSNLRGYSAPAGGGDDGLYELPPDTKKVINSIPICVLARSTPP